MDEKYTLSAAALQTAIGCDLCVLVCIGILRLGTPESFFPLMLPFFGLLAYLANRLFLRRERPVWAITLLNVLLIALAAGPLLLHGGWQSWTELAACFLFCTGLAVTAATFCLYPPTLHQLIVCLDLSAFLLVVFIAFLSALDLPAVWAIPSAAGCAAALLGVATRRVSRRLGSRDWGLLGLVFSGLSVLVLALARFAAAPLGQGVVTLWNILLHVIKLLLSILWWAFVSLLSLMPEPEGGKTTLPPPAAGITEEAAKATSNPMIAVLILALFLAAVVVFLLYLLSRLGRLRVGGLPARSVKQENRSRVSFRTALKNLLTGWRSKWRLFRFRWTHRDTPRGLYCILIHRCRMGPWHKKEGETPREFLTRLAAGAEADSELQSALTGLIPAVEEALCRPGAPGRKVPLARLIRRKIGSAARRQYLSSKLKQHSA